MEDNELIVDAVVIAKLISDELNGDNSYNNIVRVADELKIEPYQVQQFIQLYKHVQTMMVI